MITFVVNGNRASSEQPGDTPLLWVVRDELGLTGTKFGCGIAQCGACTVHVNGVPTRSCVTPVSAVSGKRSTTPQGGSPPGGHPLQKAGVAPQGPPRGASPPGPNKAAAAVLVPAQKPTPEENRPRNSGQ